MNWIYGSVTDFNEDIAESVYRALSESRRNRIDRFKRKDDRYRSLLGEYLLKKLLKEECGIREAKIECAENGRPFLKDSPLFLSISHSGDMVACAVCDRAVGIDIERLKPINARLIDRVCTEAEREYVLKDAIPSDGEITERNVLERFYEIWTGKEAYFKKQGTGITDFKSVNILELKREVKRIGEYLVQII